MVRMTLLLSRKVNVTLVMSGAALSVPLSWLAAGERPSRVSAACVGSPLPMVSPSEAATKSGRPRSFAYSSLKSSSEETR